MKIAVVGCAHGQLDRIYQDVQEQRQTKIDLLIICGDFQAVRNENDLQCMAVPVKYRELGSFYKYYTGQAKAPVLTIFVGGNHEASNYLQTLAYGGWVAENIFYLGYAAVVRFGGLRIGGISGIYNRGHDTLGHFESLPYNNSTLRSAYHVRNLEVYRMLQLAQDTQKQSVIDVFITHDWPINIHTCGDWQLLLRKKKHFKAEVNANCLGNPLYEPLVSHLKPRFWFAAHLHVRFEATVVHTQNQNQDNVVTNFLALDKINFRNEHLEVVDIESGDCSDAKLEYDPEWLAVLRATNHLMSIDCNPQHKVPSLWRHDHQPTQDQINEVVKIFEDNLSIPNNFEMCEPVISGESDCDPQRINNYPNNQTTEFCSKLGLMDPIQEFVKLKKPQPNPDQITISDEEDEGDVVEVVKKPRLDDEVEPNDCFVVDRKGDRS